MGRQGNFMLANIPYYQRLNIFKFDFIGELVNVNQAAFDVQIIIMKECVNLEV